MKSSQQPPPTLSKGGQLRINISSLLFGDLLLFLIVILSACSSANNTSNDGLLPLESSIQPIPSFRPKKHSNHVSQKTSERDSILRNQHADVRPDISIVNPIDSFYQSVTKLPQTFTINTQSDTTIFCEEGTSIFIPAYSFRDENGTIITDDILFQATEFLSIEDILLNRLNTMSGNFLLETGGMLYLKAELNQNELQLIPGKNLTVEIPTEEIKSGMQVFNGVGEAGNINWVLADNRSPISARQVRTALPTNEYRGLYASIENQSIKPFMNTIDQKGFKKELVDSSKVDTLEYELRLDRNSRLKGGTFIRGTGKFTNTDIRVWYNIERTHAPQCTKLKSMNRAISNFTIQHVAVERKKGFRIMPNKCRIPNVLVHRHESSVNSQSLEQNFNKKQRRKFSTVKIQEIITAETNIRYISASIISNSSSRKAERKLENLVSDNVSAEDTYSIGMYTMKIMKLGYINVDRFYNDQRAMFSLSMPADKNTSYQLVFKNFDAFVTPQIHSNRIQFEMIPQNEAVVLVALKVEDKQLKMAKKEFLLTGNLRVEPLEYSAVTVDKLKSELSRLQE